MRNIPPLTVLTLLAAALMPATAAEADADQLLRQMSGKLAAARSFSVTAQREIAAALVEGRDVPEKARITVAVLRPDKLSARSVSRWETKRFVADGRTFTILDEKMNHYATVPMRTSIDGLVEQIAVKYGFMPPLAEFALSDVYADIRHKSQSIAELGRGYVPAGFLGFGGSECRRVALSGKVADTELWIGIKDQLPRRLIVAFKDRPSRPQIRTDFMDWNLAANVSARDFAFVPPKGAMKIEMLTTAGIAAARRKAPPKKN